MSMCERNVHMFEGHGDAGYSCRDCGIAESDSLREPVQWLHMHSYAPTGSGKCACGAFRPPAGAAA